MIPGVLLGLAIVVSAPKVEAKKEAPTLVGKWVMHATASGGETRPSKDGGWIEFAADGKCRMREGANDEVEDGAYTIDLTKDPLAIDITSANKPGLALPALYKLDSDTLTLAVCKGEERPKDLASPPGSDVILITLKRAK